MNVDFDEGQEPVEELVEEPEPEPVEAVEETPPAAQRALVVMHVTTTMGQAGERLWVPVDDRLALRASKGLLTVLQVEDV